MQISASAIVAMGAVLSNQAAFAQATGCESVQPLLMQRKSIADKLTSQSKGKIDARVACAGFTQMVTNGTAILKFVETNKEWCQIPDSFAESVKADHTRAIAIKNKACNFAAKQADMEKRAKAAGNNTGLLGGNGLSGTTAMPQGAL